MPSDPIQNVALQVIAVVNAHGPNELLDYIPEEIMDILVEEYLERNANKIYGLDAD